MKTILTIAAALLFSVTTPAISGPMSVNVSMPGAVNPFTGYQMTYTDKERKSCTFRFNQPGDGLSYLTADQECPSFATERRVFMDAQKALTHMQTVSTAFTFAEYSGEGPDGQQIERAKPRYRCMKAESVSGYLLSPESHPMHDGWYRLYYYPHGYKPHMKKAGIWKPAESGSFVVNTGGGPVTIDASKVHDCNRH